MDLRNLIGYVAATLSIFCLIPQVVKTWKSKSTSDISLAMYILGSIGALFWIVYGVSLNSMQIILTNSIVLICFLFILSYKIKYK